MIQAKGHGQSECIQCKKEGKLKDDNRNCVTGFTDTFEYGKESKVILEIKEV